MLSYAMAFCRFLNSCALSVVIPACSSKHQASCVRSSIRMMMQSHRFRGAALDLLLASRPQLLVHAPLCALHDVAVGLLYAATPFHNLSAAAHSRGMSFYAAASWSFHLARAPASLIPSCATGDMLLTHAQLTKASQRLHAIAYLGCNFGQCWVLSCLLAQLALCLAQSHEVPRG